MKVLDQAVVWVRNAVIYLGAVQTWGICIRYMVVPRYVNWLGRVDES